MATPSLPPKILLLGATGYVGGSVLHRLLTHPSLASILSPSNPVTLPVRPGGGDRIPKLTAAYGPRVKPIAITSLDDVETTKALAAEHDIVVNAGTGFHPPSAEALVRGLAARKEAATTGARQAPVWMVHTSGCSNISDKPITGAARPDAEYDDADAAAVFAFEAAENEREWYAQRAAELVVLRLGEELGVGAISIQAPCIFGTGEGLFQQAGLMIPVMMASVLQQGYGVAVGDGTGDIDYVHIADLADLYVLCVLNIVEHGGSSLETGRRGIIFPTAGRTLTRDIAQRCLDVTFAAGHLPKAGGPQTKEIRTLSLEESAAMTAGSLYIAETGLAGHRKTKGTVARTRLGWKPVYLEDAWKQDFETEMKAALDGKRASTFEACIAAEGH